MREANLSKTAIFLGHGVDPDGLSSQAVMASIIEALGGRAHSFYKGAFNRPQNITMRQVLGLRPQHESEFQIEDGYTCIIAIDGPASSCPVLPDFIIDHHEQTEEPKVASDVRFVGATASIIWEYAVEAGLDFDDEAGARLATALAIGIKTDTKDSTVDTASHIDYEAQAFCLSKKDNELYKRILKFPKPLYYNDLFVVGWNAKVIEGSVLVTGLGIIPESRGGVISDLAEQFSEVDGIRTTVVVAMINGSIDISVRSTNSSLDVNEFVRKAFGVGGGKVGAGRARIPVSLFENLPQDLSVDLWRTMFEIVKLKALLFAGDKK
jgi:nanoRNase/pAp phosphatase (c-di-AMP/oligoRNAs hydrolase)